MESNPYASPSANLYGTTAGGGADAVSEVVIRHLQGTKPWVQFMSIMAFIGAVFMVGSGVIMLIGGAIGASAAPSGLAATQGAMMVGLAVFYGIMGFMYIYPGIKLWKYGARIGDLIRSRSTAELEQALNEQRALWKFVGILTIISIVMVIGIIFVGVAAGISAAGAMSP